MRSFLDVEYKENLFIDLHLPESENFDLFIYFHGGGLEAGDRKGTEVFAKDLTKSNIGVASVEYRMYANPKCPDRKTPEGKFPDFIVDSAEAIKFLKDNMANWGTFNRIFVGGSSAGGYISMMLCFDDRYLNAVGLAPTDIDGYIHDAGQPTAHFNVLREMGIDSRRMIVDEKSPIFFVGLKEKYAPMLFIVSDNDIFARYEQTMLMIKTLEHFEHKDGIYLTVQHGGHCEHTYKVDSNGESVFAKIILDFISKLN